MIPEPESNMPRHVWGRGSRIRPEHATSTFDALLAEGLSRPGPRMTLKQIERWMLCEVMRLDINNSVGY